MIYLINFAELNDFEIHEKEVQGSQSVNTETDVNDGVENFSIFASHKNPQKR